MKRRIVLSSAAALLSLAGLLLVVGQASAHVVYGDFLNVTPNQDRQVGSNAGWLGGQSTSAHTNTDTHLNRFLGFELTQQSTVNFTIEAIDGFVYTPHGSTTPVEALGDLNPGYALFAGLAPNLAHDGQPYTGQTPFATWSPFNGFPAGTTPTSTKWGEYSSNSDFGVANGAPSGSPPGTLGEFATLDYVAGDGTTGDSISGQYVLGPGLYSLVVGGNNQANLDSLFANMVASNACDTAGAACDAYKADRLGRGFNVQFSVTPVPLPAAVWLFGSGVAGIIAFARRRMSV
ncbi:MAG: VPLPA-CTERM sorting domain-containing protein [Nitrospira sp.]|nr:VPLPA-CTERM sorting domain-containing protein [Nitrospira sp.]